MKKGSKRNTHSWEVKGKTRTCVYCGVKQTNQRDLGGRLVIVPNKPAWKPDIPTLCSKELLWPV